MSMIKWLVSLAVMIIIGVGLTAIATWAALTPAMIIGLVCGWHTKEMQRFLFDD